MAQLVLGADGAAIDPNDREAVIGAAEAVPGIEDSDINDGWLIEHTQTLSDGGDMIHYAITLPDGTPFACTPFKAEHRRDMSKVWMATVRARILQAANEAAEITRAAALKARRDKQMQGAGIQIADQMPTAQEAATLAAAVKQAPPPPPEHSRPLVEAARAAIQQAPLPTQPPPSSDPIEHAQQQLEQALAEQAHWQDLASKASRNAKTAQKAVLRWKTIVEAFTESEPEPAAAPLIGRASLTRAENLARKLQTSATATHK